MSEFLTLFTHYGLSGLVIGALFLINGVILKIVFIDIPKFHSEERKAWNGQLTQITERHDERQNETNSILRELTRAISEMNHRHRRFDREPSCSGNSNCHLGE